MSQALKKAKCRQSEGESESAVKSTIRHLMDREGVFVGALRFYLDLREVNYDGSSVLSKYWQTTLTPEGKVKGASTWDVIASDNMIEVRPFQRVVILADVPMMDLDYFEYDNLCLLEFACDPEGVIRNHRNLKRKDPRERLTFEDGKGLEFSLTAVEKSRLYLKQAVNAHIFGNSDRTWNTKKLFKVGTKMKPNGESFFPEFRLEGDRQASFKFTSNMNFEVVPSDDLTTNSAKSDVFGDVDSFKKMRVLYTPLVMTPGAVYSPRLCLTALTTTDGAAASEHQLLMAPKTYYSVGHKTGNRQYD